MTERRPPDDRVGDATVDAAWRRAAREQPPAAIDAAILAAAREAVSHKPPGPQAAARTRWWLAWQPFAAAAGVIGLSFLLVQVLPRSDVARAPAPSNTPRAPVTDAERAVLPPAPAQPQATVSTPPASEKASGVSAERGAASPAFEASAKASDAAAPESPASWASRIVALYDAGDSAAATAELLAFRAAHGDADAYLPERLRLWAASVADEGHP